MDVLVKDVMIKEIFTIRPIQRVALARLRMLRHGIGALPVVDDHNKLLGIITLRDIDLAGNESGALCVEDLMTIDLITGFEDTSMTEIAETMLRTGIQRIPIIDKNNKLIGLITQTIVIRTLKNVIKMSDELC